MAKTIKFNLICDNKPVRTIEDLQNNFSVEDILAYYNNGLLLRWLDVRGYKEEYEQVSNIISTEPIEIVKNLITVFNMESDEQRIEEKIYILEYLNERKELSILYEKQNYQIKAIIEDYEVGYRQLIDGILQKPDDIAKIKANISEIVRNYSFLLELNHRGLFKLLMQKSILAIMCLLMTEQARKYYLPTTTIDTDGNIFVEVDSDNASDNDKVLLYQELCDVITKSGFKKSLGDHLKSFSGKTEGYWKDIEPDAKRKYMIISMQKGNYVRSVGDHGGDLGYDEIAFQFVILKGIDYKSNNPYHELLYMEV